jgi:hypothetical protein
MIKHVSLICAVSFSLLLTGCSNRVQQPEPAGTAKDAAAMLLSSTAFANGQAIPGKYTCHGQDISPPLQWSGVPPQAKSIALTVEDPDAPSGTFTHWVIFNVPATATGFPENVAKTAALPNGVQQGNNSFGNIGYNGPCPPGGKPHHYIFKIYALDTTLTLDSNVGRQELLSAMNNHILAHGELTGTYQD